MNIDFCAELKRLTQHTDYNEQNISLNMIFFVFYNGTFVYQHFFSIQSPAIMNNSIYCTMVRLANQNRADFNYSLKSTVPKAACKSYIMNSGGKYILNTATEIKNIAQNMSFMDF